MRLRLFTAFLASAAFGLAGPAAATALFSGDSLLTIRIVDFAADADGDGLPDDTDANGLPATLLGFKPAGLRIDGTFSTGASDIENGTGAFTVSSTPSATTFAGDSVDMQMGDRIELQATVSGSAAQPPTSSAIAAASTEGSLDFFYYSDDIGGYFVLLEVSQTYTLSATADDLLNEAAQVSLNALVEAGSGTLHAFNDLAQSTGPVSGGGSDSVIVALLISPLPLILQDFGISTASLIATNDIAGLASADEASVEAPEPATLGLLGLGLLAAGAIRRRR